MTVEVHRSGNLRTTTKLGYIQATKEGTWQFQSYDPLQKSLRVKCTSPNQTTEHDVDFEDSQTNRWISPNLAGTSKKIRFHRCALSQNSGP
jgi:hypothetical protein